MKSQHPIIFITGNPGKAEHVSRLVNIPITHKKLDLPEIQSLDLEEIVVFKVKAAFEILHEPVLVEDTGLIFNALGKLPGPFIKFFLHELGNEGLSRMLNGYTDRSATAETVFGFHDGKGIHVYKGTSEGTIADSPRGTNGFGWDPVYIPKGFTKTHAEMSHEEVDNASSMRQIALRKFEEYLKHHA